MHAVALVAVDEMMQEERRQRTKNDVVDVRACSMLARSGTCACGGTQQKDLVTDVSGQAPKIVLIVGSSVL